MRVPLPWAHKKCDEVKISRLVNEIKTFGLLRQNLAFAVVEVCDLFLGVHGVLDFRCTPVGRSLPARRAPRRACRRGRCRGRRGRQHQIAPPQSGRTTSRWPNSID